jgi:hypothetical protein
MNSPREWPGLAGGTALAWAALHPWLLLPRAQRPTSQGAAGGLQPPAGCVCAMCRRRGVLRRQPACVPRLAARSAAVPPLRWAALIGASMHGPEAGAARQGVGWSVGVWHIPAPRRPGGQAAAALASARPPHAAPTPPPPAEWWNSWLYDARYNWYNTRFHDDTRFWGYGTDNVDRFFIKPVLFGSGSQYYGTNRGYFNWGTTPVAEPNNGGAGSSSNVYEAWVAQPRAGRALHWRVVPPGRCSLRSRRRHRPRRGRAAAHGRRPSAAPGRPLPPLLLPQVRGDPHVCDGGQRLDAGGQHERPALRRQEPLHVCAGQWWVALAPGAAGWLAGAGVAACGGWGWVGCSWAQALRKRGVGWSSGMKCC